MYRVIKGREILFHNPPKSSKMKFANSKIGE